MNAEKALKWIDRLILFCLCSLVIVLPIANVETIRAFSFGIPAGLWLIKMILQRQWLLTKTPMDFPILLFSFVGAFSLVSAVDWKYSFEEYVGEWLTGIFLFYLLVNNIREEQMKVFLGALLLGNLLMVHYGIFAFFQRGGSLFQYHIRAGSLHSGFGTFSTYLMTIIPYLLVAFFFLKKYPERWLIFILLVLNFFALYLTHARSAWIGAAVLLLLIGWKFLSKKVLILSAACACLLIFAFAPKEILYHYTDYISPEGMKGRLETGDARWILARFSWEKIKENPFQMLGFGQRSFVKNTLILKTNTNGHSFGMPIISF